MRLRTAVTVSALALVLGAIPAVAGPPAIEGDAAVPVTPWPGGSSARTVDVRTVFGPDMSGLHHVAGARVAADRLWAVRNDGRLFRLVESGGKWRADTTDGWKNGKRLAFPDGRRPDAEAVVLQGWSAYVGTERDGTGASRPSVLRHDVGASGGTLTATHEWNLAEFYPGISPNLGIEALTYVPNDFLVAGGFVEDGGREFDPGDHPRQYGGGVFMVVVEAPGLRDHVDVYVPHDDGSVERVARIAHPLPAVTELEFEPDTGRLWAHCDDFCDGQSAVLELGAEGRWGTVARHSRIAGLPNQNFEGLTIAADSRCVDGRKPVWFSNDSNNDGHALWRGTVDCGAAARAPRIGADASAVRAGQPVKVRVEVQRADGRPAAGKVAVKVGRRERIARLANGAVVVGMGRFVRKGVRPVTLQHAAAGTARTQVRVTRARVRLVPVRAQLTARRGAALRVAAKVHANGLRLGGKVHVRVDGRRVAHRVVRRQGRLVVRITAPRRTGAVRVRVRYAGGAHTTKARVTFRVRVR